MTTTAERNKALVLDAMTALFQRRDARAVERLYAPDYIQHNPTIPQARAALTQLVTQLPASVFYEPGLIIAESDFVAIHGRIRGWAAKPQIAIDIFRIENGLLAEHWDVLQDEAPAEGSASGLAMFSANERERQNVRQSETPLAPVDYDRLMQANLAAVFSERGLAKAHPRHSRDLRGRRRAARTRRLVHGPCGDLGSGRSPARAPARGCCLHRPRASHRPQWRRAS